MSYHVKHHEENGTGHSGEEKKQSRVRGHIRNFSSSISWRKDKQHPKIKHPHLYGRHGGPEMLDGNSPFTAIQRQQHEALRRVHNIGTALSSERREEPESSNQQAPAAHPGRRNFHLPKPNNLRPHQARETKHAPWSSSQTHSETLSVPHVPHDPLPRHSQQDEFDQDMDVEEDALDPSFLAGFDNRRSVSAHSAHSSPHTSIHSLELLSPFNSQPRRHQSHSGGSLRSNDSHESADDFGEWLAKDVTDDDHFTNMLAHPHQSIQVPGHGQPHVFSTSFAHSHHSGSSGTSTSPAHSPATSRRVTQHRNV
ncbi:hypothetical protein JCM5353_000486 [Sporobolomyces roseus]